MRNAVMTDRSKTSLWLPINRPNPGAQLRLFCFPYAGGSAAIYRKWSDALPPSVDVCPVQLPGREHRLREKPFTSLPALIPAMASGLKPYFDKPFVFFGHSLGALMAFELARHLRREGGELPLSLFVSGRPAAQIPDVDPITYNLPEPEFIEELRSLDGTPKEVLEHPELMQIMMPILRADFEMVQTYSYTPEPRFDFPISAFGGLEDQHVSPEQLKAWQEQTAGRFVMRMLPGGHFFLNSAQPLVLRKLSQELQEIVNGL